MKHLITGLLLFLVSVTTYAQKQDTIFVNMGRTSYVLCPDSIILFEVGSKEYKGAIQGDSFFLKPIKEGTKPTSLLIKTVSDYIERTVAYSTDKTPAVYDLRTSKVEGKQGEKKDADIPAKHINQKKGQKVVPDKDVIQDTADTQTTHNPELVDKLNKFMEIVSPYKTLTRQSNRVILSVGNIRLSNNQLFIKIGLTNYSQHRFIIENMDIVYLNQAGDLLGSKTELQSSLPVLQKTATPEFTDLNKTSFYGFVLDGSTIKGGGTLSIQVKEDNSSRIIPINIPGNIFIKN